MSWIAENLSSALVGIGLILLLTLAVRGSLKSKKSCGSCAGCASAGGCSMFQAKEGLDELTDSAADK